MACCVCATGGGTEYACCGELAITGLLTSCLTSGRKAGVVGGNDLEITSTRGGAGTDSPLRELVTGRCATSGGAIGGGDVLRDVVSALRRELRLWLLMTAWLCSLGTGQRSRGNRPYGLCRSCSSIGGSFD